MPATGSTESLWQPQAAAPLPLPACLPACLPALSLTPHLKIVGSSRYSTPVIELRLLTSAVK